MLTRRDVLKGAVASGVAGLVGPVRLASAAAPQPRTKVNFDVPPGGCDCHVHVFGDPKKYPFFSGRTYTPETASADELEQLLASASPGARRHRAAERVRHRQLVHARRHARARRPRAWRGGDRRQDDRGRARRHGQGRHSRHSLESRDRGHQRPGRCAAAIRECRRACAEARVAHPVQHAAPGHRGAQPAVPRLARRRS